jgi:hypothetical protein
VDSNERMIIRKMADRRNIIVLMPALNYRQGGLVFFTFLKFYLWQRWRFQLMRRKICTEI